MASSSLNLSPSSQASGWVGVERTNKKIVPRLPWNLCLLLLAFCVRWFVFVSCQCALCISNLNRSDPHNHKQTEDKQFPDGDQNNPNPSLSHTSLSKWVQVSLLALLDNCSREPKESISNLKPNPWSRLIVRSNLALIRFALLELYFTFQYFSWEKQTLETATVFFAVPFRWWSFGSHLKLWSHAEVGL